MTCNSQIFLKDQLAILKIKSSTVLYQSNVYHNQLVTALIFEVTRTLLMKNLWKCQISQTLFLKGS